MREESFKIIKKLTHAPLFLWAWRMRHAANILMLKLLRN
jgi:hypothetical protein